MTTKRVADQGWWVLRCAQDDKFVEKKQIPLRGMTERKAKARTKAIEERSGVAWATPLLVWMLHRRR
jgi:hypothetical protein